MGTQQTNDAMDDVPDAGANDGAPQSTPASKSDKVTLVIRSQEGPCAYTFSCIPRHEFDCHIRRIAFQLKVARTKPLKAAFDKAHVSSTLRIIPTVNLHSYVLHHRNNSGKLLVRSTAYPQAEFHSLFTSILSSCSSLVLISVVLPVY